MDLKKKTGHSIMKMSPGHSVALGTQLLGTQLLGTQSLGTQSLGTQSLGTQSLHPLCSDVQLFAQQCMYINLVAAGARLAQGGIFPGKVG
jgi:hypothetical protein